MKQNLLYLLAPISLALSANAQTADSPVNIIEPGKIRIHMEKQLK
ncbi:MAG: hypothetical protein ACK4K0_08875 [Flavobacteriales bacterium]